MKLSVIFLSQFLAAPIEQNQLREFGPEQGLQSLQNYLSNALGSTQNQQTYTRQTAQSQFANDWQALNQNEIAQGESNYYGPRPFQNQVQSQTQTGHSVAQTQVTRDSTYLASNLETRVEKLELQVQKQNDLVRRLLTAYLRDSGKFLTDVNAALSMTVVPVQNQPQITDSKVTNQRIEPVQVIQNQDRNRNQNRVPIIPAQAASTSGRSVHKLVGTLRSNPNKGVLMVNYQGQWGTVCDDNFGQREADVACRAMNYRSALSFNNVVNSPGYESPTGANIVMDEVRCSSDDNSLLDCSADFLRHNCNHGEDIVLNCQN